MICSDLSQKQNAPPGALTPARPPRAQSTSWWVALLLLPSLFQHPFAPAEEILAIEPQQRTTDRILLDGKPFDFSHSEMTFGEASPSSEPLTAILTVRNAHPNKPQMIRLKWEVYDFGGERVHQAEEQAELDAQAARAFQCSLSPNSRTGPFRFAYELEAAGLARRGFLTLSQASAALLLEDFEKTAHPVEGPVRMDPAAAHSGRFGLRASPSEGDLQRLGELDQFLQAAASGRNLEEYAQTAEKLKALGLAGSLAAILKDGNLKENEKRARLAAEGAKLRAEFLSRHATILPLAITLPGQPTQIAAWVRADRPGGRIDLNIHSPHQRWTVAGPEIDWQGWKQVTFDLPVYSVPHHPLSPEELAKSPEAKGPPNYPLRLDAIVFRQMAAVAFDTLTIRIQLEAPSPLQVLAGGDKPAELLFPGDPLRVRIQNTSLTRPLKAQFQTMVVDLARVARFADERALDLPPTGSLEFEISTADWPMGVWSARFKAFRDKEVIFSNFPDTSANPDTMGYRFVLYLPEVSGLNPLTLPAFLRDGDRVELELGKTYEVIRLQWHNSYPERRDGIEPREGLWMWQDYDAQIEQAAAAGKSVVARLGLTPAWASPAGRYDAIHNYDWVGSPFILPDRTVTWYRHVYQVVKRYRDFVSVWEVWNEPDEPAFNTTAQEFTERLLKPAHRAARSADPGCKLLMGGITKDRIIPFLRDLIQHRGHELVDAIGLHPLVDPLSPERAFFSEMLEEAYRVAEKAGAADKLWITELGWNVGRPEDISELEQAQYLSRALVLARFAGIRRILIDLHSLQWERKSSGALFRAEPEPGRPPTAEPGFIHYRLSALAFKQFTRILTPDLVPVCELFLRDRFFHLSRAYLFQDSKGYLLVAWRLSGSATLTRFSPDAEDMVGNRLPGRAEGLEISPSPIFIRLPLEDLATLQRRLERMPVAFEEQPASRWKMDVRTFVDVGDPAEEQAAGYRVSGQSAIVTKSSLYPNKRPLKDAGRVLHESESYTLPLAGLGDQDYIVRRRVDYEIKDQACRVSVDGREVGLWLVPGQDRSRHWRDDHFVIPNRLLAGKESATLTLAAVTAAFTTYELAAGPHAPSGLLYLSDLQPLVDTEGWIGLARPDTSFLHSPLSIQGKTYSKGMGVHAPSLLVYNLNRQFKKFHFHCGIDDVTEGKGSVLFKVIVDGKSVYDSKRVDSFTQSGPQEVDVTGRQTLQLVVEDALDGKENDVADWSDARLTY